MLRLLAAASAVAYPLALVAGILAFRFVGERWWVTLTALYLPRIGFALPLPFVLVAAYFWGALLARGLPAWVAATSAVYVHGLAGDLAAARLGQHPSLAGDLLDDLQGAIRRLEEGHS